MSEIRLAGNLIENIGFTGFGHLQLVHVDGSQELEIEVQIGDFLILGNWQFRGPRDHTDPEYTSPYGNPARYEATSLDLGSRDPDDVWDVLKAILGEFAIKGIEIDYDTNQNSNSYINTLRTKLGGEVRLIAGIVVILLDMSSE